MDLADIAVQFCRQDKEFLIVEMTVSAPYSPREVLLLLMVSYQYMAT